MCGHALRDRCSVCGRRGRLASGGVAPPPPPDSSLHPAGQSYAPNQRCRKSDRTMNKVQRRGPAELTKPTTHRRPHATCPPNRCTFICCAVAPSVPGLANTRGTITTTHASTQPTGLSPRRHCLAHGCVARPTGLSPHRHRRPRPHAPPSRAAASSAHAAAPRRGSGSRAGKRCNGSRRPSPR